MTHADYLNHFFQNFIRGLMTHAYCLHPISKYYKGGKRTACSYLHYLSLVIWLILILSIIHFWEDSLNVGRGSTRGRGSHQKRNLFYILIFFEKNECMQDFKIRNKGGGDPKSDFMDATLPQWGDYSRKGRGRGMKESAFLEAREEIQLSRALNQPLSIFRWKQGV